MERPRQLGALLLPANTIGTVRVASSNGATAALEKARMTSGASATNSADQRMSMRTFPAALARPLYAPGATAAAQPWFGS
jgi:hypothetical protein